MTIENITLLILIALTVLQVSLIYFLYKSNNRNKMFKKYLEKIRILDNKWIEELKNIMNGRSSFERLEFLNEQKNKCRKEYLNNGKEA